MRRLALVLCAVALVGGCEWDGPPTDVRVVNTTPVDDDGVLADSAEPRSTVVTLPPSMIGEAGAALEDRPAPIGALSMPDTVAVVGDSLTVSATEEISSALTRSGVRSVLIEGRESRRMVAGSESLPSGLSAIDEILAETRPDLWVVALGTNDVGAQVGSDRFRDDVRATLTAIPDDAPVVWVDLWIRDRQDEVVEANATIRAEIARRAGPTDVVDWYAHGSTEGAITGDGVHLTERGQDEFASAIAGAVVMVATR